MADSPAFDLTAVFSEEELARNRTVSAFLDNCMTLEQSIRHFEGRGAFVEKITRAKVAIDSLTATQPGYRKKFYDLLDEYPHFLHEPGVVLRPDEDRRLYVYVGHIRAKKLLSLGQTEMGVYVVRLFTIRETLADYGRIRDLPSV